MAGFRGQGPLCATTAPASDAGTLCRARTPAPGAVGQGANEFSLQTKTKLTTLAPSAGGGGLFTAAQMLSSMVLAGTPDQLKPEPSKPEQPKPKSPTLSLQYEPTKKDFSPHLAAGSGLSPVSPFLALAPGQYMVHGNSEITIRDNNGKNVAQQYDTFRQWRTWNLALGTGYTVTSPPYKWAIDTQDNGPSWKDVPGDKFVAGPADWDEQRNLLEFVAAVDHHPEIGSLYFFVVVSIKPSQYRVEMSSALFIPGEAGDPIPLKNTPQPWAKESGCTIKLDSGWLKAP